MFAFLPGLPGQDDLKALARRVDTARHNGVPSACVLELDLMSIPPETTGFDPLAIIAGGGRPLVLRQAIAAIHRAAEDDRVAGLIARVQLPAAAPGPVQELRDAIVAFGAVKPTLAWAETYPGTLSYYLASAFREVWMQPSGTVGLVGFATNAMFLRDALDKAGIEAQFVARGEYKSAANLFTEDRYTDPQREADGRMIESLQSQVWQAIAESRSLTPEVINALADTAPLLRDDAVTGGLVDRIGFRDEAYARLGELSGGPAEPGADADSHPDALPRLYLSRYARSTPKVSAPHIPGRKSKPTIAVVTLHGPIVSGRGGPQVLPLGKSSAGGDTIAAALREAAADDDVSAIVLRVESPGGSVTGSETIWREVVRAREHGKPVVASMGAVAASGGYYVSMPADEIVANAGTITGSIGVVTGKLVSRELKDKLGVGSDSLRTNLNADAWSSNAPFTDEQHAHVEAEADLFYADFVERAADGRKLSVEQVDEVARGRIWTGADAKDRGLVDQLGGLRTAITRAKVLAGLDPETKVRVLNYPGSSWLDMLRPKPSSQPAAASLPQAVGSLFGQSVLSMLDQAERTVTGVNALWLGEHRF
ncbi:MULTISPECIES: signal peptide peptidase SppA [unclassified Mycolicibacterium]|uniref:signal peptide peptidase SppA n=1 Tax=unclassified Mycolicibacterium TaxID=2636767 RepID=UPI0012DD8667|nr:MULTISPECIES: signal peptide peptidase SppA [unclassified Mycolicibacterium]MUL81415.1 signal peptide peptidase SppA [Mycolicibacterium sp. CBMA 329]MUL87181.1 signal peptide peptidase SppA [Mycolicibacterium sp. CBMA 331]MUL98537.1 signal peptide peptidase SppA [Mycolicibacterium sp. CBMA 334]MUM29610.1 signal peptide peptidase SppA [Mycolicibacterium sp. CBMA 295]MUM37478.1 signal peptide peptidase SppA [Mycolicibacterium sp. CBMA 247]